MARPTCANALEFTRRLVISFALAGVLLPWTSGAAAPARADHTPRHEPDARLQVVIKGVNVFDDRDPGEGEIRFWVYFFSCSALNLGQCSGASTIAAAELNFSAGSWQTEALNRVFPGEGELSRDQRGSSPGVGFAVYDGRSYLLTFSAYELDDFTANEFMGSVVKPVRQEDDWSIGTHTLGSWMPAEGDLRAQGDYAVEFEIRRTPLPDLAPLNMKYIDAGEQQFHCVVVDNVGRQPSELFQMAARADGALVTMFDMPALEVGQTTERCLLRSNLPAGEHMLSFRVDERSQVAEMNELNNEYEHRIPARQSTAAGPQPVVGPTVADPSAPPPAAAQADLAVKAIRVRGEEPGGPSDCHPGRNDVTVVIKNQGTGAAASFAVRVQVDDDDDEAVEKMVATLDVDKELEVRFDDIRVKKGERELTVTADVKKAIAESDEGNNELRATVKCKDEGD